MTSSTYTGFQLQWIWYVHPILAPSEVLVESWVPALDFTQRFQRQPCKSGGTDLYQAIYVQIQFSNILVHYLNVR